MSALAQTTGATFEVATVKVAEPPQPGRGMVVGYKGGPGDKDPGLWQCTNCVIPMLIQQAYDVKHYQITPLDWMQGTRFEIKAKVPEGATKEQFKEMLRNLLAERFKLEFHRSQKEMQVYDLVVAKGGLKLKESADKPPEESTAPSAGRGGRGPNLDGDGYPIVPKDCSGCMYMSNGKARYYGTKTPIKDLVEMLGNQLARPVTDSTGLTGKYDITLSWSAGGGLGRGRGDASSPSATPLSDDSDLGVTIESALQSQLGLKLESKKGMVDIIIVDKAEKTPADN